MLIGKGGIAGAALIAALCTTGAEAKWLRADTNNFIVYSEGNEKDLRNFAEKLERFDATLRYRFKIEGGKDTNPLTIYLVSRAADAGRLASGRGGSSIAGFYSPNPEGSFAVSHREDYAIKGTPQSQQTLFHEYTHHFMRRFLPGAFPAWFIEGFAEYYSTADFTKEGKAEIGKPRYSRAYGLLAMPKIPADTLLFKRPWEMRDSGQIDVYYGRSWLLTHMLFNSQTRSGQLRSYIGAINNGVDTKKAVADSFGDLGLLDKELNRYVEQRLTYSTTADAIAVAGPITIGTLTPAQDAVVPLRLERLSASGDDRLLKARTGLKKLAVQYPGDAQIWFELAMTEWQLSDDNRDKSAARAAVDKALAIDPKHVRANVLLGEILTVEVEEKPDASAADWNAVRKPIILANRTNPEDPMPLQAYYRSFINQGTKPPPIAIDGLARAFHLGPEDTGARMNYAFALANDGRYDEAIKLARILAFDPHDGGGGEELLNQLEAMRDHGKGAASDKADAGAGAGADQ